ncbi:MAG: M42 family metallopeptidase [Brevinema sp.]
MKKYSYNLLKELTETCAVSGDEQAVSAIIRRELETCVSQITYDKLGSVICTKNQGSSFNVVLMAHMDEVGFLIKRINPDGTLKLFNLGNVDLTAVLGTKVKVRGYTGIVCSGDPKNISLENFYIDLGVGSLAAVLKLGIQMGDSVSLWTEFELAQGNIIAKSLDNRIGCAVGIEVFQAFRADYNLHFIGSVQEEVGTRGAQTSISMTEPDICIVLDTASPKDSSYNKEKSRFLGKGACLCFADKGALGNRRLIRKFQEVAEKYQIPFQFDFFSGGGTDAGVVQRYGAGVPVMALIIPVRYCHTANSMASIEDYNNTILLLSKFLEELDPLKSLF